MKETVLHPIRRIKSWLEGLADRPHALAALFACGFIEASVFPLPPDVPLISLGVVNPRKSLLYALVVVAGSAMGSLLGYYIGYALYGGIGQQMLEYVGATEQVRSLLDEYRVNAWLTLLLAGFTPIPFMAFTIAAGSNAALDPVTLFLGALCGRLLRFIPVGILLHLFGPKVKDYFERYLERTILIIGFLIILFIVIMNRLS
ncbi:MAG: hypothetical protein AAB393_03475 [Bacteroidota bacterium]